MRIAQIAPLAESVPPKLYGGTERVVAWLVDELVNLSHEVTLFASGDSVTGAELIPICPRALRLGRPRTDPMAMQAALIEEVACRANDFDLIHAHIDWLHLPLLSRLGVPFLTTCHGRLDLPLFPDVIRRFPKAPFVSISENQRIALPDANWIGTIYHGLPQDLYRPSFEPGSYLAFLGRLTAEKGQSRQYALREPSACPFTLLQRCRGARRPISKSVLSHRLTESRFGLSGKSTTMPSKGFLLGPLRSCFRLTGLNPSAW